MSKIIVILSGCILLLSACTQIKEKKSEIATSLVEKSLEAVSGQKIDVLDIDHIGDNYAVVDVQFGDENLEDLFKKGFGSITASKETIAITVAGGEKGQDNIIIGFTGKDLIAERPIRGKMVKGENDGFVFSKSRVTDKGMEVQMSFEAEGEIVSLQKDKVVIKVKGKTGSSLDAENPEKWKPYEGTIILNHPVFQALQSSKDEFVY